VLLSLLVAALCAGTSAAIPLQFRCAFPCKSAAIPLPRNAGNLLRNALK
jgi:hypothetical protein